MSLSWVAAEIELGIKLSFICQFCWAGTVVTVVHDNQVQLPHFIVSDSSIDHLSDPSPLKFPQIPRKIGFSIYTGCDTEYRFQKYKP